MLTAGGCGGAGGRQYITNIYFLLTFSVVLKLLYEIKSSKKKVQMFFGLKDGLKGHDNV